MCFKEKLQSRDCHSREMCHKLFMSVSDDIIKYAYYPVNVSRAIGPRIVDRVMNNLSNDSEM